MMPKLTTIPSATMGLSPKNRATAKPKQTRTNRRATIKKLPKMEMMTINLPARKNNNPLRQVTQKQMLSNIIRAVDLQNKLRTSKYLIRFLMKKMLCLKLVIKKSFKKFIMNTVKK